MGDFENGSDTSDSVKKIETKEPQKEDYGEQVEQRRKEYLKRTEIEDMEQTADLLTQLCPQLDNSDVIHFMQSAIREGEKNRILIQESARNLVDYPELSPDGAATLTKMIGQYNEYNFDGHGLVQALNIMNENVKYVSLINKWKPSKIAAHELEKATQDMAEIHIRSFEPVLNGDFKITRKEVLSNDLIILYPKPKKIYSMEKNPEKKWKYEYSIYYPNGKSVDRVLYLNDEEKNGSRK